MSLYLGIDSGTQSTRMVVLDADEGRVVSQAAVKHSFVPDLPAGHVEQHPQEWHAALEKLLEAAAAAIEPRRLKGIGVSGQQHGFVALDAAGEVIRPAKLWCDTSTTRECALLTSRLGGRAAVIRKLGLPFLPGYTAPKILWLKRNEPKHYRRLRQALLPHDYLNYCLTGNFRMECGDASGTALMNVRKRAWSSEAMRAIDPALQDFLPPLSAPEAPAGTLLPSLAQRHGFRPDVVVSAGGGDNMMAAIGSGNVRTGAVTASLGTSGTVFAYSAAPVIDPRGEIAAFCDSTGGFLPLVCTMNVTLVTDRFRSLFGWSQARFDEAVMSVSRGADGLRLVPHLDGERTPNLPGATGTLTGITHRNMTPAHLARAALEGVIDGLAFGVSRLRTLGLRPKEIRVTGGGARSPVWRQLMADIFGVPVVKLVNDECAALGAALQAMWCDRRREGRRGSIASLVRESGLVRLDESSRCVPH